jgi:hypothetical protein
MMMSRKSSNGATAQPLNPAFPDFTALGGRQMEAFLEAQSTFQQTLQEAGANWLKRLQTEGELAAELGSKLTAAHSLPEVAAAWQDWSSRHMELMNEDAKRAVSDAQTFLASGTRAFTGGMADTSEGMPGSS